MRRTPRPGDVGVLLSGLGAAACYLAIAAIVLRVGSLPGRVLYDGLAPPPPYRWVHPAPELARDNQAPERGAGTVPLTALGSQPESVSTDDGQASVDLPEGAVGPEPGAIAVEVQIAPLDPGSVGTGPPGLRFDSNAYQVTMRYVGSGVAPKLRGPVSIVLRFATGATGLVRAEGSTWIPIKTTLFGGFLQLAVASSQQVGIFAAVAPRSLPYVARASWWLYLRIVGAVLIAALAIRLLPEILGRVRPAR